MQRLPRVWDVALFRPSTLRRHEANAETKGLAMTDERAQREAFLQRIAQRMARDFGEPSTDYLQYLEAAYSAGLAARESELSAEVWRQRTWDATALLCETRGHTGYRPCEFCRMQTRLDNSMAAASERDKRLREALAEGKTRYSRDHGMPNPSEPFPVEVVFTMQQWEKVRDALKELKQ